MFWPGRDGEHPGVQRRTVRILEEGIVVEEPGLALEQRDPALEARGLGQLIGLRIVLDVELFEIVLGAAGHLVLLGPGELLHEESIGRGEDHLEGLLVHHFELGQLSVGGPPGIAALVGVGIAQIGIVPELHVGGGEGLAVRPFMALAQNEGIFGGVVIDRIAFRRVRHHARPVGREPHQRLIALVAHQHRERSTAHQRVVPVPALLADAFERLDDQRIGRQALGDRRQRAAVDLGLQEC